MTGAAMPILRTAWMALALSILGQPAPAQETTVLAIDGWRQEAGADGVVYFHCASSICAAGSEVSYKAQPHRTTITLADFEQHHRNLVKMNEGNPNMSAARIRDVKERTVDGVRVLQISREVDWKKSGTTFSIEARLIGTDKSFSLVSDSKKREWTANNFEGFLRPLVAIAGIKGQ